MKNILLYIIVFICGAAVLALEILGTRIIGPFYGVSLFLWSALIAVTLIALSAGYMIGGRMADKFKSYSFLGIIILISGLLVLLLPWIRNSVISLTESMGLRTAVLFSSFILFFPPLTLLGMVSPYAIKLRTESLDVVGKSSGDLYAVSTIGSVIAALLTGFIFIPILGVVKLTTIIGAVLVLTGLLVYSTGKTGKVKLTLLLIFLLLFISSIFYLTMETDHNVKGIVSVKESAYAEIKVMDTDENRFLLIDGGIHSAINKQSGENLLPYVAVLDLTKYFLDYSGDMLLIGLGGGSVLKSFYDDNWDIETVEIDPVVTSTAEQYFNIDKYPVPVFHRDGREYLSAEEKNFDLIILDAFGSSSVPFHLTTVESFIVTKARLKENGILAANIESLGWDDIIIKSVYLTLKQVFTNVMVFPIAEPPNSLGNIIIAASDKPFELKKEIERDYTDPDYRFSSNYEMAHAWDNRFIPDNEGAIILTDDLNPVEIWSERINLHARKELHDFLGDESFLW